MPGIGIVTNPNSRRNRRFPEQMRRLGYILGSDDVYELTNQPQDIGRVAEEFKSKEIDILALNGGDGTNHVTLTTFIEIYGDTPLPKIAFLRGGTMNTISNAVGIVGTPGKILLDLVERYHTGQDFDLTERDLLKIVDGETTRYGFIFGAGIIANFLDIYYEDESPSPTVAAKVLATALGSAMVGGPLVQRVFAPITCSLQLDDLEIPEHSYNALGIATIEQIGLGFRPFMRAENRDHAFHCVTIDAPPLKVARALWNIRFGRPAPFAFTDYCVTRAVIQSKEDFSFTIDGDMHMARDLTIEAGPRVQIIQG